jgi:hypothetical protein
MDNREDFGVVGQLLTKTLCGDKVMSDVEFLETMARSDRFVANADTSGLDHMITCGATVARQLIAAGDISDGIKKWSELSTKMWQESKYFRLYQEALATGTDPNKAFEKRGWEM